jgi:hypothetical protein
MEGLALAIQQSSLKNAKIMLNSSLLSRRRRTVTHLVTEISCQAWCGRIGTSVKVLKILEPIVWLIFLALGKCWMGSGPDAALQATEQDLVIPK